MPTGIEHLEPFQMLDAFAGLGQGIVDGVFDAGGGRTYQFDFLVGVVVAHAVLLSPGGCPESLAVIFPTARINRSESRCSFFALSQRAEVPICTRHSTAGERRYGQ